MPNKDAFFSHPEELDIEDELSTKLNLAISEANMLNKHAFFWRPEEFEVKNEMRTPLSDLEVNVFAKNIAIYRCIETDAIYSEIFPKILKEAKAFNETIKAQCQPH